MKKWLVLCCLFVWPVAAAESMEEKTYTFTAAELQKIVLGLQEIPAKWANPVLNELARMIQEKEQKQDKPKLPSAHEAGKK